MAAASPGRDGAECEGIEVRGVRTMAAGCCAQRHRTQSFDRTPIFFCSGFQSSPFTYNPAVRLQADDLD
jgi:hypothetical protein